jgi:hypothetical protein
MRDIYLTVMYKLVWLHHSSILEKTIYPGSRKLLHSDDPLRIDTAFHSAKPEKGTVNKRTMQEEKAIARYQDNI